MVVRRSWRAVLGLVSVGVMILAVAGVGGVDAHGSDTAIEPHFSTTNAGRSAVVWTQSRLPGAEGQDASAIVIDSSNPKVVYAGTSDAGLFKSTDGGNTFRVFRMNFPSDALAVDLKHSQSVYNGGVAESELSKTSDAGRTWKVILEHNVRALAADPRGKIVYAICSDALRKTTDGGQTWRVIKRFTKRTFSEGKTIATDSKNPQVVYLGQSHGGFTHQVPGGFKSIDGGRTWTRFTRSSVEAIAIDPRNTRTVYIGTDQGSFKSNDGGKSWKRLAIDPKRPEFGALVNALAVDPRTPTTIYAGTYAAYDEGGVYKSTNAGQTWRSQSQGLEDDLRIHALAVSPTGRAYAGTNDGFFRAS